MNIFDTISLPNSEDNADGFMCGKGFAAIIDGAANLGRSKIPGFKNDVIWLVRNLKKAIPKHLSEGETNTILQLEKIRIELNDLYSRFDGEVDERPFACIGVVRAIGEMIEIINMGDLTFLIERENEEIFRFGNNAVKQLDAEAISTLKNKISDGIKPHSARVDLVREQILQNRAKRNILPGYEVFDTEFSCLHCFERILLDRSEILNILMMTDGFYRAVDVFNIHTDLSLMDAVKNHGASAVLDQIRNVEERDADCIKFPRFKKCDDATAILVNLDT